MHVNTYTHAHIHTHTHTHVHTHTHTHIHTHTHTRTHTHIRLLIGGTRGVAIIEIAVNGSGRRLVPARNALERTLLLIESLSVRLPVGAL